MQNKSFAVKTFYIRPIMLETHSIHASGWQFFLTPNQNWYCLVIPYHGVPDPDLPRPTRTYLAWLTPAQSWSDDGALEPGSAIHSSLDITVVVIIVIVVVIIVVTVIVTVINVVVVIIIRTH